MIDVSEGVVFRLKAKVVGTIGVDGDVKRRFGIHQDCGTLRIEEVSLQHVAEGMFPYITRNEGAQLQAAAFQRIHHILDLSGAIPVAPLRGPVEAVLGIVIWAQALPGDVVAVHTLALRMSQIKPCLLQPLETDRILSLMMGKTRIYACVRWDILAEPSGDDLRPGAAVDSHHSFVFIESKKKIDAMNNYRREISREPREK